MRKLLLTIFVILILATVTIAQEATECEEKDLTPEIDSCKAKGGDYETKEDSQGCKYIECKDPNYVEEVTVQTTEHVEESQCGEKDLTPEIDSCKAKGGDYETKEDSAGCKYIECKEPTDNNLYEEEIICPTEEETNNKAEECEEDGLVYEFFTDEHGCNAIKCEKEGLEEEIVAIETISYTTGECKSEEDLASMADDCESSSGIAEEVEDEYGCTIVKCEGKEETTVVEEIKYEEEMQTIECKKFKDSEGCEIISCVDGSEYNLCKICETNIITTGGAIAVSAIAEKVTEDKEEQVDPLKEEIKEDDKFQPPKENVFKKMGNFFKGFFGN